MTEPTHHFRRDTESQVDNIVRLIALQVAQGEEDKAGRDLRAALSAAWASGCVAGLMHRPEGEPALVNPYDETDKS
jgi:hypothetical protein